MQTSIRNQLSGKVLEIMEDKVLTEVVMETAAGKIAAVITTRSAREMNLQVGDKVAAIIKATNVSIGK
ncbi:TOBE domain-containing protein [Acidithiobacillus sp. AMEEHan]|uniref:TOBE domain-containing protein n=1 Tax=Acidithiobacillus sp. AMEEHan TaxID=2994951 RepID=UPI0027E48A35|nr:TOBE domain-containing protein [Acidithiobacillus sp. AMEEHan]